MIAYYNSIMAFYFIINMAQIQIIHVVIVIGAKDTGYTRALEELPTY